MATKKTQLKDSTTGEKMYPVTSSACVGMSDGSGSLDKHLAKITTEYNVSKFHPTGGSGGSNKYDLSTAIGKVPEELRVPGLGVSFLNQQSKVEKWTYQGGTWAAVSFIRQEAGGNKILEWKTDVETTRKQVLQQERKKLLQISYENADGDVINEQYIGTSFTDEEWGNDAYWERIPNQEQLSDISSKLNFLQQSQNEGKFYLEGQTFLKSTGLLNSCLVIENSKRRLLTNVTIYAAKDFNSAELVIAKQAKDNAYIVTNIIPLDNYLEGSTNTIDISDKNIIVDKDFAIGVKGGDSGFAYSKPISTDYCWKYGYTLNIKSAQIDTIINLTTNVSYSMSILVDYKDVDLNVPSDNILHNGNNAYGLLETIENSSTAIENTYGDLSSQGYNPSSAAGSYTVGPIIDINEQQVLTSVDIHVITARENAAIVLFEWNNEEQVYKNRGNFPIGSLLEAGLKTINLSKFNLIVKNKFCIGINTDCRWKQQYGLHGTKMDATSVQEKANESAIVAFMTVRTKSFVKAINTDRILFKDKTQSSINKEVDELMGGRYQWSLEKIQLPRTDYPFHTRAYNWDSANGVFQPLDIPYKIILDGIDFYWNYAETNTTTYFLILKNIGDNVWSIYKSVFIDNLIKGNIHVSFGDRGVELEAGKYAIGTASRAASFTYWDDVNKLTETEISEKFPFGKAQALFPLLGQTNLVNEGDIIRTKTESIGCLLFRYHLRKNIIVDKSNPLWGKTLYVVGDSEAEGSISKFYRYSAEIGARNNMRVVNKAVSGSVLKSPGLITTYREWIGEDADYIIAQIGYNDRNDFYTNSQLPDDSRDITHFKGALNMFLFGLLAYYPKAKVLYITPHSFGGAGYVLNVIDDDLKSARLTIPKTKRSMGLITYYYTSSGKFSMQKYTKGYGEPQYLEDDVWKEDTYWEDISDKDFNFTGENDELNEFIERRCRYFHIPCINPTKELGMNFLASGVQRDLYCSDSNAATHLSIKGHIRVATAYEHRLRLI